MLPLAAARACLSSPAPPPRSQTRAAPLCPLHHRRSTATLPRPARIPLLRSLGATASAGASSRPARDRVIYFGKHKGQVLGMMPPSYLRWLVAELDYGATLAWACLAREVLDDPVNVDRVEWEHAHRFVHGDSKFDYIYDDGDGPLQEMAECFGWDLSDEDDWGRLDFRLLGTSYGGRIPRKVDRRQSTGSGSGSNRPPRGGVTLFDTGAADPDGSRGKRDHYKRSGLL